MTASRRDNMDSPFNAWIREQAQLDSVEFKISVTDSDLWVHRYSERNEKRRADASDCRWQQIQKWLRLGYVPTRRVAAISRVTGIKPSRLNAVVGALHKIELIREQSR